MGAFLDKVTKGIKNYLVNQDNIRTAGDVVEETKRRIAYATTKKGLNGVPTGFTKLDKLTHGWQHSDLIIIAARPGMGKTGLILSMLKHTCIEQDIPTALFTLEMTSVQIMTRLFSIEAGISSEKLRTGKLEKHEWELLNAKTKKIEQAPLYLDDTAMLSVFDLRTKVERLILQHNIKILFIDYLQLMTVDDYSSRNIAQEGSEISKHLKILSKDLNIPIVVLSQLSSAVEKRRESKRPLLLDLRKHGTIEQYADVVCFIYRPEYYAITKWDDDERLPTQGEAELIVAKHRNGGIDNIRLKFIGELGLFEDIDDFDNPFEFHSKMNALYAMDAKNNESSFFAKGIKGNPDEAFDNPSDPDKPDKDVPF